MGRGMRARVVVPADLRGLDQLSGCAGSQAWMTDPQAAWARAAMTSWGLCGVVLAADGQEPQAVALVCPGLNIPSGHPLEQWSKLPDAAYLLAVGVGAGATPGDEAGRLRHLVQGLAHHLQGQVQTLEAVGRTDPQPCAPGRQALEAAGFVPVQEFRVGECQRMRLDLSTTLRWRRPELNRAWGLLAGLVPRPVPPVEPTRAGLIVPVNGKAPGHEDRGLRRWGVREIRPRGSSGRP